jgi:5-methylcytosine-specific restriction protein A
LTQAQTVNSTLRTTDKSPVSTRRARAVTADQWGKPDRNEAGEPICRWCQGRVVWPRRTFCSDACVHEWKVRSSPWYVRRKVKKRDKGICRLCGANVVKAQREWARAKPPASDRARRKRWRAARPRWEADHIVPVADGGGECGLDNYRLLCRPCHVRVTSEWRARRNGADVLQRRSASTMAPTAAPMPAPTTKPIGPAMAVKHSVSLDPQTFRAHT